jgi:hypothetical protein
MVEVAAWLQIIILLAVVVLVGVLAYYIYEKLKKGGQDVICGIGEQCPHCVLADGTLGYFDIGLQMCYRCPPDASMRTSHALSGDQAVTGKHACAPFGIESTHVKRNSDAYCKAKYGETAHVPAIGLPTCIGCPDGLEPTPMTNGTVCTVAGGLGYAGKKTDVFCNRSSVSPHGTGFGGDNLGKDEAWCYECPEKGMHFSGLTKTCWGDDFFHQVKAKKTSTKWKTPTASKHPVEVPAQTWKSDTHPANEFPSSSSSSSDEGRSPPGGQSPREGRSPPGGQSPHAITW